MSTKTGKLSPNHTAFLVCDIQEGWRGVMANFPQLLNTASKMVRAAEILEIPVIVAEHVPKVFKNTAVEVESRFSALPPNLKVGPFPKTTFGVLAGIPEIDAFLKEKDIQSVVIFGVESHICLLQTALELLDRNREVHVLADGTTSINPEEVPFALARMRQSGAFVATSESVLFQLMGNSALPPFKKFTGLIKEVKGSTKDTLQTILGPGVKSLL